MREEEIVEDHYTGMALQQVEHVAMKRAIAHVKEYTVKVVGIRVKPRDRTNRKVG